MHCPLAEVDKLKLATPVAVVVNKRGGRPDPSTVSGGVVTMIGEHAKPRDSDPESQEGSLALVFRWDVFLNQFRCVPNAACKMSKGDGHPIVPSAFQRAIKDVKCRSQTLTLAL